MKPEQILENLLKSDREREVVEFKEAKKDYDFGKLCKYFSALSNEARLKQLPQAWLVFGVKDNHNIVGTLYRNNPTSLDSLKNEVANVISNRLTFIEIYEIAHSQGRVLLFQIPAALAGIPTSYNGHYYGRDGSSIGALNLEELDRIRHSGIRTDWSAEIIYCATLDDLDLDAIHLAKEKFLELHPNLREEAQSWDNETFLNKAKITIGGKITRTALLLLGKPESSHLLSPAYPRMTWILKDKDGIEKDYQHFDMPFLKQVDAIFLKIRQLKYRYIRTNSLFPEEVDQYDPKVIREALHNAIAHQDYTLGGKITLVEFENGRLVFSNSGDFIPKSIENVIKNNAPENCYRNQHLATAMVNIKMIDTIGSGIRRMFMTQKDRFFPLPEYNLKDSKVEVTITGQVLDMAYAEKLAQMPDLSLEDIMLLDAVQKKKQLEKEQIDYLKKMKLIEGRKPNYYISKKVAKSSGNEAEYIYQKAFDDQHYKDLILKGLDNFSEMPREKINNLIIDKLPAVLTPEQKQHKVKNLLQSLKHDKKIVYVNRVWKLV